jgi:hypothetical protein
VAQLIFVSSTTISASVGVLDQLVFDVRLGRRAHAAAERSRRLGPVNAAQRRRFA